MKYELKCADAIATVDSIGAELISFKKGKEYLWYGDEKYWKGHSPVLFPNPSVLLNDKIKFYGKEYEIPKHGIVRGKEFSVEKITENSVIFSFSSSDESKKLYPFDFKLFVEHSINKNGFVTKYTVKNLDTRSMYFCIGAHPSFLCPMEENENFEDYDIVFEKNEDAPAYRTHKGLYMDMDKYDILLNNTNVLPLKYSYFDEDSCIFKDLNSSYIKLINRSTQNGIKLNFASFEALVVWTPEAKHAPFICIEPWHGIPALKDDSGNFEDKPYAIKLDPDKEYSTSFSVEILQ